MTLNPTAKEIIRTVAPTLGEALGGPLGGLAAREIAGKILGEEISDADAISAAIEGAGTEQLAELAKLDHDFALKMEELGVRRLEADTQDRASARDRQVAIKDKTPAILGGLVVAGFFGLLVALLFMEIPASSEGIFKILVGVLGTVTVQVMNFYFGSSAGSSRKNDILERRILQDPPFSMAARARRSALEGDGGLY